MEGTMTVEPQKENAEQFVKQVRRKTRRKFTAEEKIRIVIEGMKRDVPVTELCRREGIPTATYYGWVKDFMEGGKGRLKGDTLREANRDKVDELRRENERLKAIVGEKELQLQLFKKSLQD